MRMVWGMSVILITGGNGGLGIAMARAFFAADETHQVCLGVRTNRDHADVLQAEFPQRCQVLTLDVTRESDWTAAVESIVSKHGRLDVLINNAGHHEDGLLAMMTDAAWHEVLQSNLTGAFFGCRAVVK